MKRTPLLRRTPLKRTPFKRTYKQSAKFPGADFWEQRRAELMARCGGFCERCGLWVGVAFEAHHKRMRSHGVDHSLANLAALCKSCHTHIHANPAESYEAGWLIRTEAS